MAGKVINAGGGGAVPTNDHRLYKKLLFLNDKINFPTQANKNIIEKFSKFHTKVYNSLYIFENKKSLKKFKFYIKKYSKYLYLSLKIIERKKFIKTLKIKKYVYLRKKLPRSI